MPVHDIQSSFAGGEIAPEFHGRVDLAKYKISGKTCRNLIPGPSGMVYTRPGTYYVADTKTDAKRSRLVPFVPSASAAYVLEFGDQYVRFYKNGGQIQAGGGGAYEVSTPYLEADLANLKFARSADTLYIVHPSYAPRTLQRISDNSWTLALYPFKNGPFMLGNADTTKIFTKGNDGSDYISTNFDFFVAGHAGALFQITQNIDAGILSGSRTSTGVFTCTTEIPAGYFGTGDIIGDLSCGGGWRFRTHGTWVGKVVLQKSYDAGVTWKNIQFFVSNGDINFDTFGTEDINLNNGNPFLIRANAISYTSGTIGVDLSVDAFEVFTTIITTTYSTARKMYIATGQPTWNATSLWAEGSWSTTRGWPSAVSFFQDRLVFASTPTEPQAAWFTKTSNYIDFGRSNPLVDSDGITINLQSRQVNPIVNIVASGNACIFWSAFSYWSVTSDSGAFTPSTVFEKFQEARGASIVDPVIIGNRLIFIESRGTTVRDIEYQYLSDRYLSENISLFSDHLFRAYSVVDMAYQQIPDSLLWVVRSDGNLLSCTYLREQELIAWARHDTNGSFESVCSIPGSGVDEVWFVVRRGTKRYIERLLSRTTSTDPADQYGVDCGIAYSGVSTAAITGYDHLSGFTVAVVANGFVQPTQAVVSGTVTVPTGTTKASIGLGYTCDLETLNPEIPMQDGTFQGRKYQINRATFRFLNTVGGYVGPDLNNLDPINMRGNLFKSIGSSTPTPLYTGFDTYTIRPGDDLHSHIAYRQSDPMPATILSIIPLVNPGQTP